jgi:hypothetical protein
MDLPLALRAMLVATASVSISDLDLHSFQERQRLRMPTLSQAKLQQFRTMRNIRQHLLETSMSLHSAQPVSLSHGAWL